MQLMRRQRSRVRPLRLIPGPLKIGARRGKGLLVRIAHRPSKPKKLNLARSLRCQQPIQRGIVAARQRHLVRVHARLYAGAYPQLGATRHENFSKKLTVFTLPLA